MIDEAFISRWAKRLSEDIPGTLAVLLKGSHVRGDAGRWSDVDFDVLVDDTEIEAPYLTWFDEMGERLVHVSVAVHHLETWLEDFDEPADWALGFAGCPATKLVWVARPSLKAELDRPDRTHVAGEPELEDVVESLGKARNAISRNDELACRLALRDVGMLAPSLLIPLNGDRFPATKPEALRMALDLEVAPPDYQADLLALLGLDGLAHAADELLVIGERLTSGIIGLLETHLDAIEPGLAPHLGPALRDGTLRRYLDRSP